MRLHRTREEWAKIKPDGRWYHQREKMALEDLATLFAQLEAERARVVELEADATRWREVAGELAKMLELSRATCLMDCGP